MGEALPRALPPRGPPPCPAISASHVVPSPPALLWPVSLLSEAPSFFQSAPPPRLRPSTPVLWSCLRVTRFLSPSLPAPPELFVLSLRLLRGQVALRSAAIRCVCPAVACLTSYLSHRSKLLCSLARPFLSSPLCFTLLHEHGRFSLLCAVLACHTVFFRPSHPFDPSFLPFAACFSRPSSESPSR